MKYILLSLLICIRLNAQVIIRGATIRGATLAKPTTSGGGGGATWTVVFTAFGNGNGSTTTTITGINTVGSTLIVASIEGASFRTFSDSPVNTYTAGTDTTGTPREYYLYSINPTTSASTSFSLSAGASFHVIGLKKTAGGTPAFDAQASGFAGNFGGPPFQPGSITPATSADIMLSSVILDSAPVLTVNSGYALLRNDTATSGRNLWFYTKQKSDALAENPLYTSTIPGAAGAVNHMAFK